MKCKKEAPPFGGALNFIVIYGLVDTNGPTSSPSSVIGTSSVSDSGYQISFSYATVNLGICTNIGESNICEGKGVICNVL